MEYEKCKFKAWKVLDLEIKLLKVMEYENNSLKDIDLEIGVWFPHLNLDLKTQIYVSYHRVLRFLFWGHGKLKHFLEKWVKEVMESHGIFIFTFLMNHELYTFDVRISSSIHLMQELILNHHFIY